MIQTHLLKKENKTLECNPLQFFEEFLHSLSDFSQQTNAINQTPHKAPHIDNNLAMIYSISPRSKLYMQTMQSEGILPSVVVILDDGSNQVKELESNLKAQGISTIITHKDINHTQTFEAIQSLNQQYIIYSGYGGGILKEVYFELGKHFIHIHAGKLPHYKGSTTCYYSLLESGNIYASAMFLDSKLDCGDVLGEFGLDIDELRGFCNSDIDTTLEPYIRAQALVKILREYKHTGHFESKKQKSGGETYYRIHPTLKHLAIFKCFGHFHTKENI